MTEPRTVAELRAVYEDRGGQACRDRDEAAGRTAAGAVATGKATATGLIEGWATARNAAVKAEVQPMAEAAKLKWLAATLEENRARLLALGSDPVPITGAVRQARIEALGQAQALAVDARERLTAAPPPDPADLSDWSAYPRVPVEEVTDFGELCLFLGGDAKSFTGELLKLAGKADNINLRRLAEGFPREIRAYAVWKACAPIPASTLARLLEASSGLMDMRSER